MKKELLVLVCLAEALILWRSRRSQTSASIPEPPLVVLPKVRRLRVPSADFSSIEVIHNPQGSLQRLDVLGAKAGKFVYTFSIYHDHNPAETYLALAQLTPQRASPVTTLYKFNIAPKGGFGKYDKGIIFDPQFSPDGRYVLFKLGQDDNGVYHLYVLDTQTQQFLRASKRLLANRDTSWSPDGKYISYIEHGDAYGELFDMSAYLGPLELWVCDWRTQQDYLVATNNTIKNSFTWKAPHTLVYGVMDSFAERPFEQQWEEQQKEMDAVMSGKAKPPKTPVKVSATPMSHTAQRGARVERPNLYAFDLTTKTSKLLFRNVYVPTVAPDGSRVAFFRLGSQNSPSPRFDNWNSQGATLCVAHLDGSQSFILSHETDLSIIGWQSGSQELVTFKQTEERSGVRAEIKAWNLRTRKARLVARLSAKDPGWAPRSPVAPQFSAAAVSRAGKMVFVLGEATTGGYQPHASSLLNSKQVLQAVDLTSGKVIDSAQVRNGSGVDWHSLN